MAMSPGSSSSGEDDVVSAINTTPLVDVMLVLLIIFLITIPVVTHTIQVQLPKQTIAVREAKPENILISVDAGGGIYWNDLRMSGSAALVERLKTVSGKSRQPEVQVRGDHAANYDSVGKVLYACQRAGINKVSFITEPTGNGG